MRTSFAVAALTLVLAATGGGPAAAQDQRVLRDACKADYQRLCQGVQPGGGRIVKCLQDQGDKLTPACKTALSSRN